MRFWLTHSSKCSSSTNTQTSMTTTNQSSTKLTARTTGLSRAQKRKLKTFTFNKTKLNFKTILFSSQQALKKNTIRLTELSHEQMIKEEQRFLFYFSKLQTNLGSLSEQLTQSGRFWDLLEDSIQCASL